MKGDRQTFLADRDGFSGAEAALLACLLGAACIIVGLKLSEGAATAADHVDGEVATGAPDRQGNARPPLSWKVSVGSIPRAGEVRKPPPSPPLALRSTPPVGDVGKSDWSQVRKPAFQLHVEEDDFRDNKAEIKKPRDVQRTEAKIEKPRDVQKLKVKIEKPGDIQKTKAEVRRPTWRDQGYRALNASDLRTSNDSITSKADRALADIPNDKYNCDFYAIAVAKGGQFNFQDQYGLQTGAASYTGPTLLNGVLSDSGYTQYKNSDPPRGFHAGDIVEVSGHGSQHSAVVTEVDGDGNIVTLRQKWGPGAKDPVTDTTLGQFTKVELEAGSFAEARQNGYTVTVWGRGKR